MMFASAEKPAVRRDKIIIVDLEATCWAGEPPPGEQNEIIEIGVCVFDMETRTPQPPVSILVKPTRSQVSPFCTELTTLTQAMVDAGESFEAACLRLQTEFGARDYLWASWGAYDLKMFKAQCHSFAVEYPFSGKHMNLKSLFAQTVNQKQRVGMAEALKVAELPLNGTHHRGGDDAYNSARLLAFVLDKAGADALLKYW
jgi:inhibitor of KinA sporulation pathway (predicted exonuclease)